MGYKTISVIKHNRTLKSGKKTKVKAHKRKINFDDTTEPISEEWIYDWHNKRMLDTNPDRKATSKITFLEPNNLWYEHPEKYDVYMLDTVRVPEFDIIPIEPALPNQIIKVKGKFYKGDSFGRFRKTFPLKENKSPK